MKRQADGWMDRYIDRHMFGQNNTSNFNNMSRQAGAELGQAQNKEWLASLANVIFL